MCVVTPLVNRQQRMSYGQGRSQLHSPVGQEFHFPHFFLKFRSNFLIFPETLLIFFLILALRVGESPTREGPGYATAYGTDTHSPVSNNGFLPVRFGLVWSRFYQLFSCWVQVFCVLFIRNWELERWPSAFVKQITGKLVLSCFVYIHIDNYFSKSGSKWIQFLTWVNK